MRITSLVRMIAAFFSLLVLATPASSQTWLLETVDATGNAGQHTSIAVDASHVPHIASWKSGWVRFSSRSGGVWATETAGAGGLTSNRALRLDADDHPRIVYEGSYTNVLATRVGGVWSTVNIPGGYANWFTTQALDGGGASRVAYLWSVGSGEYTGGLAWENDGLAPNIFIPTDPSCALEYDSQGTPHVVAALHSGQAMGHWYKPQGAWIHEPLPPGLWPALAIGADDRVHVCYYSLPDHHLVYVVRTGPDQWLSEPIDMNGDVGLHPSLAIDPEGIVRVSYYDVTNHNLKVAISGEVGSPWTRVTVDATGDVGQWSSLAVVGDVVHVSYYDATNQDLRYARQTGLLTGVGDSPARRTPGIRAVPNPFNPSTTLEYVVPVRGRVSVTVYDAAGRVVEKLVDAERGPGAYRVQYRARTPSGVYFACIDAAGQTATTKIVLLK